MSVYTNIEVMELVFFFFFSFFKPEPYFLFFQALNDFFEV